MEPSWIRPAYLRGMCAIGIIVLAYGLLGFVLGIVHTAAPDLQRQGDPIFRIASAIVNVAEPVYRQNQQNNGNTEDPSVTEAFSKAKSELTHQARQAGINELVRGLILSLIGLGVFLFHWQRAEEVRRVDVPVPMAPLEPSPPS